MISSFTFLFYQFPTTAGSTFVRFPRFTLPTENCELCKTWTNEKWWSMTLEHLVFCVFLVAFNNRMSMVRMMNEEFYGKRRWKQFVNSKQHVLTAGITCLMQHPIVVKNTHFSVQEFQLVSDCVTTESVAYCSVSRVFFAISKFTFETAALDCNEMIILMRTQFER